MSDFDTIENRYAGIIIRYTPQVEVPCAVTGVPFRGRLRIEYAPDKYLLEYCSFERWLRSLSEQPALIEELGRLVYDKLREALGDIPLRVTLSARTTVHSPVCVTLVSREEASP